MPFEIPSLSTLISQAKNDLAPAISSGALKARFELALSNALGGLAFGQYQWFERRWRQLWPTTAQGSFLDRWAGIVGLARKAASTGSGTVGLTGTPGATVPINSILQRQGDGLETRTDAAVVLDGLGVASVTVTTVDPGSDGNAEVGTLYTFTTTPLGLDDEATIEASVEYPDGINSATDEEGDDTPGGGLRARILDRLSSPPSGGSFVDYRTWALEVPSITRAWASSPAPGIIDVVVVSDGVDPITPPPGKLEEVVQYITDPEGDRAPATDTVGAKAPDLLELDIEITLSPNTPEVIAEVQKQLEAFFSLRPIGAVEGGETIHLSNLSEAISEAPGEDWHEITAPAASVPVGPSELPVLKTLTTNDP